MFDWYYRNRINRAFKKNVKTHKFRSFKEMQTILILFDYSDWPDVRKIVEDLTDSGKKVHLWTLIPKSSKVKPSIAGVRAISSEDLSFFKIINKDIIEEFDRLKYDTLFNFSNATGNDLDALSYLLAMNKAEFSVGIAEYEDLKVFDFILLKDKTENLFNSYKQIKHYCSSIQSLNIV